MNMIRVWGGGIYESEDFYDLCDEKGLLVWQDFMFACALYRGDEEFLALVEDEAEYQVQRLAHRACLALWCGNNEMEQSHEASRHHGPHGSLRGDLLRPAARRGGRVRRRDALLAVLAAQPRGLAQGPQQRERRRQPLLGRVARAQTRQDVRGKEVPLLLGVRDAELQSPEVAATFCPPEEFNVFAPAMENHQKNGRATRSSSITSRGCTGSRRITRALSYLSQLNQLYCLKVGIEHFRRSMPRTMGALYWQLNDCWPVFSWSSVEFGGKWKALHYGARRFFGPALVSAHVPGDETRALPSNRLTSTIHDVDLYTVYDGEAPEVHAHLGWELRHLDGRRLEHGGIAVLLRLNESMCWQRLDFAAAMAEHTAAKIYLHVILTADGHTIVRGHGVPDGAALHGPAPRADRGDGERRPGRGEFEIEFRSPVFQHRVKFELDRRGVPRERQLLRPAPALAAQGPRAVSRTGAGERGRPPICRRSCARCR